MARIRKLVGKLLKQAMKTHNVSLEEILRRLHYDKQHWNNIENGHKNITLDKLEQYIDAIGAEDGDIFKNKMDAPANKKLD